MTDVENEFYSIKDIVEIWKKTDKEWVETDKDVETSISKKFVYVLKEKLKLEKEEINWFKEKLPNGRERFIFRADKRTPECIKYILDICGKRNGMLIPSEEYSVIEDFAIILPYPLFESDDNAYGEEFEKRAYRIEQAVRAFCKESWVKEFFIRKIFVSIDAGRDITIRRAFYEQQYKLISGWKDKWSFIMDKANEIRRAERAECLYEKHLSGTLQSIEKFCETGKSDSEEIQKAYGEMRKISHKALYEYIVCLYVTTYQEKDETQEGLSDYTKDECIDMCKEPFKNIIKHCLQSGSLEDFEYMMRKAMKELEIINKILKQVDKARRRREKPLYPRIDIEVLKTYISKKDCEKKIYVEEDLKHLFNIRRHLNEVENKTISILDYMQ